MLSMLMLAAAVQQTPDVSRFSWQPAGPTDPATIMLVQCFGTHCVQVGGYSYDHKIYRKFAAGRWGEVAPVPPAAPPIPERVRRAQTLPTGVRSDKLGVERYTHSGVPFTAEESKATMADDSALPHLTLIGDKAHWREVLDWLPADFKSSTRLHCYPSDHWAVAKFSPSGTTLVYQMPDGKVLARSDNTVSKPLVDDFVTRVGQAYPDTPARPKSSYAVPAVLAGLVGLMLFLRKPQ